MRITRTGMAATAITTVLAVGVAVPALAQDAGAETGDTATENRFEDRAERFAEKQEAFAAALAAELGLDTATVEAALESVAEQMATERQAERQAAIEERLDAAVEDGSLTREQADALREAAEEGVLGFGHRGGRRGPGHMGPEGFEGFGPGDLDTDATESSETAFSGA